MPPLSLWILLGSSIDPIRSLAFSPAGRQIPALFDDLFPKVDVGKTQPRSTFTYTHLEGNSQLWQVRRGNARASLLVDPVASQLDFGVPDLYRANKRALTEQDTIDAICRAQPSHCLLTMGLDDHTHLPTIDRLQKALPELKYVVAPSCVPKLAEFGMSANEMVVLDHSESCTLVSGDGVEVTVTATEGALVGPPWQKRENGYWLQLRDHNEVVEGEGAGTLSVYYEPHADVVLKNLGDVQADILVSPVKKQSLPAQLPSAAQYTLVYGGERTLEIAERLGVRAVVPLVNGDLDFEGPAVDWVSSSGDVAEFERLVDERNMGRLDGVRVAKASAGIPLTVSF